MSGYSCGAKCPNCGKEADLYSDWKPVEYSRLQCYECGLLIQPKVEYLTLEQLNLDRKSAGLEPLQSLPPQTWKM